MKQIAGGVTDFKELRKQNGIYVDKTGWFHRMIAENMLQELFFIARPRRFGKRLMISTFKYIFGGQREIFDRLDIAKTDYDWKTYPVLRFDFANMRTK